MYNKFIYTSHACVPSDDDKQVFVHRTNKFLVWQFRLINVHARRQQHTHSITSQTNPRFPPSTSHVSILALMVRKMWTRRTCNTIEAVLQRIQVCQACLREFRDSFTTIGIIEKQVFRLLFLGFGSVVRMKLSIFVATFSFIPRIRKLLRYSSLAYIQEYFWILYRSSWNDSNQGINSYETEPFE